MDLKQAASKHLDEIAGDAADDVGVPARCERHYQVDWPVGITRSEERTR